LSIPFLPNDPHDLVSPDYVTTPIDLRPLGPRQPDPATSEHHAGVEREMQPERPVDGFVGPAQIPAPANFSRASVDTEPVDGLESFGKNLEKFRSGS
jgi:hypothetical protein